MFTLAINAGSSSVKYAAFDARLEPVARGIVERVGQRGGPKDYTAALEIVVKRLAGAGIAGRAIDAVGHRVVHGGLAHTKPTRMTPPVVRQLASLSALAPLHNPANVLGIRAALRLFPCPQVAVFDTGFYHALPEKAYRYALSYALSVRLGIRRFGFHGISHQYVYLKARGLLGRHATRRTITCHLGNGCSVSAIKDGRAIDTSMGYTPLEGLMMGTRSGDLDPAIVEVLASRLRCSTRQVVDTLNKRSGLLGVSGVGADMRDVLASASPRARLAVEMYCYRLAKYIAAYTAALGGLDALVFTGGIGEHQPEVRSRACRQLGHLGVFIDRRQNYKNSGNISRRESRVSVLVVPTDEERMIAQETRRCIHAKRHRLRGK